MRLRMNRTSMTIQRNLSKKVLKCTKKWYQYKTNKKNFMNVQLKMTCL